MMLLPLSIFVALLSQAVSEKDSSYYPDGIANTNVNQKMYWRDASNVLQDLDKFDALYVSFHNCA
jgi:hypothetical protein